MFTFLEAAPFPPPPAPSTDSSRSPCWAGLWTLLHMGAASFYSEGRHDPPMPGATPGLKVNSAESRSVDRLWPQDIRLKFCLHALLAGHLGQDLTFPPGISRIALEGCKGDSYPALT